MASVLLLVELALGALLLGEIVNVPEDIVPVNVPVLNVNNYRSRITVDLYNLAEKKYSRHLVLVDENWTFRFPGLEDGKYELVVQSVDFALKEERFRININNDNIVAHEDPLWDEFRNTTAAVSVSEKKPLQIEVMELKQYYEDTLGSLSDMVLNSPLGFIFKNRGYTVMFFLMLLLAAFPYVLGIVNPELAAEMREVQRGNTKPLQEKEETVPIQSVGKAKNRKTKK